MLAKSEYEMLQFIKPLTTDTHMELAICNTCLSAVCVLHHFIFTIVL